MAKKRTNLFSRLMISVALPEIIIFSIVAIISYIQLKDLFQDLSKEKVENFQEELVSILNFQNVSLGQFSKNTEKKAQDYMKKLRFEYFLQSDSIETADLTRIRAEIGMSENNDIYIIDTSGIVVNTTFQHDLRFDLFSISSEFTDFLKAVFSHDYYTPSALNLETNTRKFKKYIYQTSKDGNYIIQLGFYLPEADKFNAEIAKRLNDITKSPNNIISIDVILAPWKPFSLYTGIDVDTSEYALIKSVFELRRDSVVDIDNKHLSYIFFERSDNEEISWKGILKVVYDKEGDTQILIENLVQKIGLFGIGMILLFVILFFNVRYIVKPIHKLSRAARKLGEGELEARADSDGTKEIYYLSESFNHMADNLERSHIEITRKNHEILASINYAKRIQEAILPPYELVEKSLPQHFILYKPKDIVAGDFYWHEKIGDNVFIAAADCTGHGVPGAMVSVVCSNSLNRAVKELKLREPGQILDKTRELVIETFEKSQHDVKDGMDICFCRLNLKKREVVYSGAQNSLYRVTKKVEDVLDPKIIHNDNHVLLEYKADKQPIGKFIHQKDFTQHTIKCKKGDYIYLFTDGYADQFGGPEGKKFMYKPFKKMLLSFYGMEMTEQKKVLDDTIESWRKFESQIDDICIIGIRID